MRKLGWKGAFGIAAPVGLIFCALGILQLIFELTIFFIPLMALYGFVFILAMITARNRYGCTCGNAVLHNFCSKCGTIAPDRSGADRNKKTDAHKIGWIEAFKKNTLINVALLAGLVIIIADSISKLNTFGLSILGPIAIIAVALFLFVIQLSSDKGRIRCECGKVLERNSNFCVACGYEIPQELKAK